MENQPSRPSSSEMTPRIADQLLTERIFPKPSLIRERLGYGSPNAIQGAYDQWLQDLVCELLDYRTLPEIPEAVAQGFHTLWKEAARLGLESAEAQFETRRRELEEAERRADERVRLAHTERDSAIQRADELGNLLDRMRVDKQVADDKLAAAEQQSAKNEAERATLVQRLETREAAFAAEQKAAEQRLTEAAERYEKERERNQANENNLLMKIDKLRQVEADLRKAALEAEKTHQKQLSELRSRIQAERDALATVQTKNAALQTAVELGDERFEALTHEIEVERKETQAYRARAEAAEKSVAIKEAELATTQLVHNDLKDQVHALREEITRIAGEHREAERRWAEERAELRGQTASKPK